MSEFPVVEVGGAPAPTLETPAPARDGIHGRQAPRRVSRLLAGARHTSTTEPVTRSSERSEFEINALVATGAPAEVTR